MYLFKWFKTYYKYIFVHSKNLSGDMGSGRKLKAASIENFVMRGSTTGLPTHVEEVIIW